MSEEEQNNIPETIVVKDKKVVKRQMTPEHLEMLARARTKALEVRRQKKELREKEKLVKKEEKQKHKEDVEEKYTKLIEKEKPKVEVEVEEVNEPVEPEHQSPPVSVLKKQDKKPLKKLPETPQQSEDDEPEIIYKKKPKKKKKQVIVYESSSSDEEEVIKIPKRKLIKYAKKYNNQDHTTHRLYQDHKTQDLRQQVAHQTKRPAFNPLTSLY